MLRAGLIYLPRDDCVLQTGKIRAGSSRRLFEDAIPEFILKDREEMQET
jgi:hypothetical protein